MTESEKDRRIAQLEQQLKEAGADEPTEGLYPKDRPKFRVIRKWKGKGELVPDAFVLTPAKHQIDRDTIRDHAMRLHEAGQDQYAAELDAWMDELEAPEPETDQANSEA